MNFEVEILYFYIESSELTTPLQLFGIQCCFDVEFMVFFFYSITFKRLMTVECQLRIVVS